MVARYAAVDLKLAVDPLIGQMIDLSAMLNSFFEDALGKLSRSPSTLQPRIEIFMRPDRQQNGFNGGCFVRLQFIGE
jgi:hypothetical protein